MSRAIAMLGMLLLLGCEAVRPAHHWSGPRSSYLAEPRIELPEVDDPIEPVNRAIWSTNDVLVTWVVSPLATAYRTVVPEAARQGLSNFFTNVLFPGRFINNLLQAKYADSWVEVQRFGVNTTVGLLGVMDVASSWDIAATEEDFGQTFGSWGWKNSTYFVMPVLGPTNVRDMVGLVGDTFADPAFYYPPTSTISLINRLSDEVQSMLDLMHTHYDYYELSRLLYVERRDADVEDVPVDTATEVAGSEPVFLTPEDPHFGVFGRDLTAIHPRNGRKVPYTVWMQEEPAPLVIIVPGFGDHRRGPAATALAEIAFDAGMSAVTLSSSMNYELIDTALTAELPGYLPWDSQDVHRVLDTIVTDLDAAAPGSVTARMLVGLSFGGLTTLFIAADEASPEHYLVSFDAYAAINAPLDLDYALEKADGYYNTLMAYPVEERGRRVMSLHARAIDLARGAKPTKRWSGPKATREDSEVLVGFDFRSTVRNIIFQTQMREDRGVLKGKLDPDDRRIYEEISQFSYREYMYTFLLPYVCELLRIDPVDEAAAQRLMEACSVRSIASALASNPRVRFISSEKNVLLHGEDAAWIEELLGPVRVSFERGEPIFGNVDRDTITKVMIDMAHGARFSADRNPN